MALEDTGARQGDQLCVQWPVPPKPRAKAAEEKESELKPLAAASVTPVRAISCVRAEQQPVLPEPRVKAAAEIVRVGPSEYGSWLSCARACCHSSRHGGRQHARLNRPLEHRALELTA